MKTKLFIIFCFLVMLCACNNNSTSDFNELIGSIPVMDQNDSSVVYFSNDSVQILTYYSDDKLFQKSFKSTEDESKIDISFYKYTDNGKTTNEWITLNRNGQKSYFNYIDAEIVNVKNRDDILLFQGEHLNSDQYDFRIYNVIQEGEIIESKKISGNGFATYLKKNESEIYLEIVTVSEMPDSKKMLHSTHKYFKIHFKDDGTLLIEEPKTLIIDNKIDSLFQSTLIRHLR